MLTIFKKLFGKAAPKPVAPVQAVPLAPSTPMPTIEVAHLSLGAITSRFTDELKPLLAAEPESAATVALPLPTILKQLPAGCVKMSLATLQRQAHGLIKPIPPGDKRMVDVPLVEIFRHIRLSSLKRRPDQRPVNIPETGFNLFGDALNPRAVSPDDHLEQIQVVDLTTNAAVAAEEPAAPAGPRVLKMDDGLRQHFANTPATRNGPTTDSPSTIKFELSDTGPRAVTTPGHNYGVAKPAAPVGKPEGPTLDLKVAPLSVNWPEDIQREIAALDPATIVTLPAEDVGAGLARGKVSFTWAQIRAWIEPSATGPTSADGGTALPIPLKLVAPAYLAASKKPKVERKSMDVDETIPELFNDGREPQPKAVPAAPPVPEPQEVPPTPEVPVEAHAPATPEAAPVEEIDHAPVGAEAAPEPEVLEIAPAPVDAEVASEPVATEVAHAPVAAEVAPEPVVVASAAAPAAHKAPETVGELFGQPHKKDWTPTELIAGIAKLPGIAGGIVALHEGLQVASSLPEGVKSEVVAAFLPQIFARLNQYSGEMKLGEVDDLLFTTHGAHCQIYRLGYIYLAVLGKPGESLPWHELRLVADELARQTHK